MDSSGRTADSDPEQWALIDAANTEITALLGTLPDRDRDILIMRVVEGMSTLDTARVLDMSAGAVRVAQHRALVRMRRILAGGTTVRRPAQASRSGHADTHTTRTDTEQADITGDEDP
jgi:DNA-directed RNA polymerase specialized sigma24 family protein